MRFLFTLFVQRKGDFVSLSLLIIIADHGFLPLVRLEFIFKDAIEMGNGTGKATLVSEGDPVDVPSVDLLIAGPSCKDFSPLNANPKPIHDDGQSGMTWRAVSF